MNSWLSLVRLDLEIVRMTNRGLGNETTTDLSIVTDTGVVTATGVATAMGVVTGTRVATGIVVSRQVGSSVVISSLSLLDMIQLLNTSLLLRSSASISRHNRGVYQWTPSLGHNLMRIRLVSLWEILRSLQVRDLRSLADEEVREVVGKSSG